jgi:hypothetical protein
MFVVVRVKQYAQTYYILRLTVYVYTMYREST